MTMNWPVECHPVSPATGTCSHCRKERPARYFPRDTRNRSGLSSWCRFCVAEAERARRRVRLAERPHSLI